MPELIRAPQEKRIAGAALDVYWHEPPWTQDPQVPEGLLTLDNVILTPHNGSATHDVRGRKAASVARVLVELMRGERPATLVNPEVLERVGRGEGLAPLPRKRERGRGPNPPPAPRARSRPR